MDKKSQIVLVLGIVITIIIYFIFDIYLAGIFFVLAIALFMSLLIMEDSKYLPEAVSYTHLTLPTKRIV